MSVKAKPVHKGTIMLSFIGNGRYSTVMATAAPTNAFNGDMKNEPGKRAKKNPVNEPSKVLALFKGNGLFETSPPKIDAVLSPKVKMAMAALLIGGRKSNSASRMPTAKYMGAAANS